MEETPPLPDPDSDSAPAAAAPAVEGPPPDDAAEPVAAAEAVEVAEADEPAEASASAGPPQAEPPRPPADLSPAACAAALAERFPALFTAGRPLPIKLRIQADIQARAPGVFSKKSLSIFLHRHTTSTPYIRALLDAQTRFDLDGQPAGEIATEHREAAVVELERRRQIVMAKRQAERDAQRAAQRAAQPPSGGEGAASAQPPRAARPPRSERANPPPRADRPPRAPRDSARFERPPQTPRPPQRERDRDHERERGRERDQGPSRQHPAAASPSMSPSAPPSAPLTPEQAADHEARRARAQLLRAFETSTISRANFCALKRIDDATLEAQLQQARAERGEPRAAAPAPRR